MSKHGGVLPIILGGGELKKGLIAVHEKGTKGADLYIVWLKKEYPYGESFEFDDVDKVQAVLHFCNMDAVEGMKKALNTIVTFMEGNDEDHD